MVFFLLIRIFACGMCKKKIMDEKRYGEADNEHTAAEPAAMLSESVSRSGLLGQVMSLSHDDKVALIRYLRQDTGQNETPLATDEFGRVVMTKAMRQAVYNAERDYEDGKCLSEEQFQQRFAIYNCQADPNSHWFQTV